LIYINGYYRMQQTIVDDLLVADRRGIAISHGFTGKLNQAWDVSQQVRLSRMDEASHWLTASIAPRAESPFKVTLFDSPPLTGV
jgi:hypothetical protein